MIRLSALVCAAGLASAATLTAQTPYDSSVEGSSVQFLELGAGGKTTLAVEVGRVPMLRRRISVGLDGVPLPEALAQIGQLAGVTFAYSGADLPRGSTVTLHAESMTLAAVLTEVLLEPGLDVVVTPGDRLSLIKHGPVGSPLTEPTGSIIGVVSDSASGKPIEAVDVYIDTLKLHTVTSDKGLFKMKVPVGRWQLRARRIGYRQTAMGIEVREDEETAVEFKLVPQATQLQDLVTTATGIRRRYELGNAITTVNADSIAKTQPVHSLTDLLVTRVPGLTATQTSGAPGDPTRLRLRGLNSLTRSNDPIFIVDGIRVYADQSDIARAGNLAVTNPFDGRPITGRPNVGESVQDKVATRSPLDQIDPNSIEKVEIFHGPSAATLYGADAANGVIVVTTRRGQEGATRWNFGSDFGYTYQPGKYPESYLRFGHDVMTGQLAACPLAAYNCQADSLVRYQMLNDPALTIFGHGYRKAINMGVSGGSSRITYAVNGSWSDESGLLKLPDFEANRYAKLVGVAPDDWMVHPQGLNDWTATGHLGVQLSPKADFAFTSTVDHSIQDRSALESQIAMLSTTYADTTHSKFYSAGNVSVYPGQTTAVDPHSTEVAHFRIRTTAMATSFTNAAHVNWRPMGWLTTTADVGINIIDRHDESMEPRDFTGDNYFQDDYASPGSGAGYWNVGAGNSVVTTINLGAVGVLPLSKGTRLRTAVGANYTRNKSDDLIASGQELIANAQGIEGARIIITTPQRNEVTTFGYFIEPTFESRSFFLSTGIRLDGADTYGSKQSLAGFPKVSASYLMSNEKFFPFKKVFSTFRVRAAYGQAGVQPGPADRLRLFHTTTGYTGQFIDLTDLTSLGNVNLKPERSSEFEGGFDADLFNEKLSFEFTGYSKIRGDALVPLTLPPSVNGGGTLLVNIGRVKNSGFEVSLGTNLLRHNFFSLSTQFHVSQNRNEVLSLGDAGEIDGPGGSKVAVGYPLFGLWAKPILHYADVNHDGVISRDEVQLGDHEVFMGPVEPKYEASLYTNMAFLKGQFTVSAGFAYTNGQLQINDAARSAPFASRALNDPNASLAEQAAAIVSAETPYGLAQLISTFRFNSLAIAWNFPRRLNDLFGVRTGSLTVQGTNLGLKTNYRGRDPNVNAYATGNVITDTGQLPLPRTWSVGLRFGI